MAKKKPVKKSKAPVACGVQVLQWSDYSERRYNCSNIPDTIWGSNFVCGSCAKSLSQQEKDLLSDIQRGITTVQSNIAALNRLRDNPKGD